MKIQLYPSLQFGWDLAQFQTVAREYLGEAGDGGAGEEEEESLRPEDFEEEEL